MSEVRIWGRVEHLAPGQFLAIASAVPEDLGERAIVLHVIAPSLATANAEKARLMVEMGMRVRASGDRVVDVED